MQPGGDLGEGTSNTMPPTVPPVAPASLRRDPQLLEAGKTFDDLCNMPEIVKTLHKPDDHQQFDPRAILTIKATKTRPLHITEFLPETIKKTPTNQKTRNSTVHRR